MLLCFFELLQKMLLPHFSPYNKKAWRKSLRHAPIKENLIVKIEISDSNSYSGTLPQPHPEEAVVDDISSIVLVDILY